MAARPLATAKAVQPIKPDVARSTLDTLLVIRDHVVAIDEWRASVDRRLDAISDQLTQLLRRQPQLAPELTATLPAGLEPASNGDDTHG